MINIYRKYQISKSLNGDEVVYLARVGKQKKLVLRARSEQELISSMEKLALERDKEIEAARLSRLQEASSEEVNENKSKLGLWSPGGLIKNASTKKSKTTAVNIKTESL